MAEGRIWNRFVPAAAGLFALFGLLLAGGCGIGTIKPGEAAAYEPPQGEPLQRDALLENDRLRLAVDRTTGTIAITDKRNGHVWLGAASGEEAAEKEIAGDYKGHVVSPFIVEYQDVQASANAFKRGNLQSEQPEVRLYQTGDRVEVAYSLKDGELRFSFTLTLSGSNLIVDIPGNRILDNPKTAVLKSVSPYPFLGSVLGSSKEGYMLIPSGPGYLIEFYDQNYPYDSAFNEVVYGDDLGVSLGTGSALPVQYPVFGIKQDDGAFIAVMGKGGEYGKVSATPSGLNTPFNWAAAEFVYLPDDYLKSPYSAQAKQFIEEELKHRDRRLTYTFLAGDDADYVGMAKAYRTYLTDVEGAHKLEPLGKEDPFSITVYQANTENGTFVRKTVAVTTFAQAQEMIRSLHDKGVRSMNVALKGWNQGGDYPGSWPRRLPPDPALGSSDDLKRLAGYARSLEAPFLLYDNYFDATSTKAGFRPREHALRNIRTGVVERKGDLLAGSGFKRYRLRPERSLAYLRDALPVYRDLGVSGLVLYGRSADVLNSDFNKSGATSRGEAAEVQREMLDAVGRELGFSGFSAPYAYAVGHAQFFQGFQIAPGYDVFNGKTVPFYPIAVHGLAGYSGKEANLLPDAQTDRLRQIEYGAVPAYIVTHAPGTELQFTSARSSLTSTRFDYWEDEIVAEYARYRDSIGSVMHLFIEDHRQLADLVYATTYEDGREIVVNYSDRPFRYGSVEVPARQYAVVPFRPAAKGGAG